MQHQKAFIFFSAFILFLLATGSLLTNGGIAGPSQGTDHGHHWVAPEEAANRANPVKSTPESIAAGAALFGNNCIGCHGENAKGDGPAARSLTPKPTDLTGMAGHHPDGDIAWKIETGKGPMPGWKRTFSETQIWNIVNFIQSLAHPSPEN